MSERCLSKIKPIIFTSSTSSLQGTNLLMFFIFCKCIYQGPFIVLVKDMKQILLTKMKELLNQGMKVQAIHAWGWFIRLLGS
ncbi:hypothetical protein CFP56_036759 [Quercus suber]|uniref:Uncharacterized protein n=1 Tax=Quercus suber TaxID=58331 RepID=A0AAW0MBB2_QUESU